VQKRNRSLAGKVAVLTGLMISCAVFAGEGEFTLIHSGDIHGRLVPRPNVRSDTADQSILGDSGVATAQRA